MPLRRPQPGGPIRRSQFGVPALELREALSVKLAAIAQRGAQVDVPEPPEPASDSEELGESDSDLEPEGPEPPSDDEAEAEDDESVASSSGASSPESSPVPSPTIPSPNTSALPSTTTPASTELSSTLTTALGPAPTSTFIPSNKDEDSDSEDETAAESSGTLEPQPTSASATAQAELSSESAFPSITSDSGGAQQSGDVWVMSGPPPRPPPSGISQSTEHLLIAAGSIGATLLIVMLIWGIYTMRRKGLTFRDLVQMSRRRRGRPDRTVDIAKPQIHRMPAYASDDKERYSLPQPPQNTVLRFDSVSSRAPSVQRDYLGSSLRRPSTPKASHRSFFEEATPPQGLSRAPSNAHSRGSSSPTLLPLQTSLPPRSSNYDDSPPTLPIQRSASFKGSQAPSGYSSERNDIVSPEAPGPTYQNFAASRRFTTNRGPNYESHFSWTQSSQAPPTPIEPQTPADNGRISVATTASSLARFRTVDSWVGNQAGRIPSTQLRSQPHLSYRQSTSTNGGLGQVDEGQPGWQQDTPNDVPEVPSVPSYYKQQPPLPQPPQDSQSQSQHQRQLTSYSDATVFRQHPGTEVQIPRGSLVPSEVLDAHMIPSAL